MRSLVMQGAIPAKGPNESIKRAYMLQNIFGLYDIVLVPC